MPNESVTTQYLTIGFCEVCNYIPLSIGEGVFFRISRLSSWCFHFKNIHTLSWLGILPLLCIAYRDLPELVHI